MATIIVSVHLAIITWLFFSSDLMVISYHTFLFVCEMHPYCYISSTHMVDEIFQHKRVSRNINTQPLTADAHKLWPNEHFQRQSYTLAEKELNSLNHMLANIFQTLARKCIQLWNK